MYWIAIALLVLLGLFALIFLLDTKYKKIFADDNFIEIAEQLSAIKPRVQQDIIGRDVEEVAEPRSQAFVTAAGVAIFYTIGFNNDRYIHHVSLSYQGHHMARSAATLIGVYIASQLNIAAEKVYFHRSAGGVYHLVFDMSAEEFTVFRLAEIRVPSAEEIRPVLKECLAHRGKLVPSSLRPQ